MKTIENKNNKEAYIFLLKKLFVEHKKNLLTIIGAYIAFWIIIGIINGFYGQVPSSSSFVLYILFSGLFCALVASKMFFETTEKEGTISLLMLPASSLQKFISRLIIVLPCMILSVTLCYFLYASFSTLTCGLYYDIWYPLYNPFSGWNGDSIKLICLILSFFLLNESFFVWGAVMWPKRSFLKTILFIACIIILFWLLVYGIIKLFLLFEWYIVVTNENAFIWSIITIIAILAVGIIWNAYTHFKIKTIA